MGREGRHELLGFAPVGIAVAGDEQAVSCKVAGGQGGGQAEGCRGQGLCIGVVGPICAAGSERWVHNAPDGELEVGGLLSIAGGGRVLVIEICVGQNVNPGFAVDRLAGRDAGHIDGGHLPALLDGDVAIEVEAGHADQRIADARTCDREKIGIDVPAVRTLSALACPLERVGKAGPGD